MFPEDEITTDLVETEESVTLGRVPLYDFQNNCYVVKDGKIIEATQDEAILQWVAFLCKTAADKFDVYEDTGFGTYIENYIGYKDIGFIESEIQREIEEKATMSRAIDYIDEFDFERDGDRLNVSMTVHKKDGTTAEVSVDVG